MTDIELGWVCGILEGEGSFTTKRGPRSLPGHGCPCIKLMTTDRDIAERFGRILNKRTHMYHQQPRPDGCRRKPYTFEVNVCGKAAIQAMEAILPHMGSRRQEMILGILETARESLETASGLLARRR